jgi:hypothetical protein
MSDIVLLDTSVYLNVLDVPSWNQDRNTVLTDFANCVSNGDYFLLPLAAVWEAGNHIADLQDGGLRRQYAQKLLTDVKKALQGETPYQATYFPEREEFLCWLEEFPGYAEKNKTIKKIREGISLADLSIIKEWERVCARHSMSRVRIWSLDSDLSAYDREY